MRPTSTVGACLLHYMETSRDGHGGREMYDDNNGKGLMYLSFALVVAYIVCNFVLETFH